MGKTYSIPGAAALLGVDEEKVRSIIEERSVQTTEEDGEIMIKPSGMVELFDHISDDDADEEIEEKKQNNENIKKSHEKQLENNDNMIVIKHDDLLDIHNQRRNLRERSTSIIGKMRRLETKVKEYKTMENGLNAEFWHLAKTHYPQLWQEKNYISEELDDGILVIKTTKLHGTSRENVTKTINGWIKDGSIINTPMGLSLPPPEQDESEEDEFDGDVY